MKSRYKLSRRSLLQAAVTGVGAATSLAAMMTAAKAGKIPQTAVDYRGSPNGSQRCDNCRLFQPPGTCRSVDGSISPSGWCKIYVPK
jgi:hypothetical protein